MTEEPKPPTPPSATPEPPAPPPAEAVPPPLPPPPPPPMASPAPKKKNILIRKLQFPTEYGFFIAVNMLDLFLTMLFVRYGAGEANPAAKWILLYGGKGGFIAYKVVLMLVVIGLCELVATKRRWLARLVLWFGILALGAVAISSALRYYTYMQTPGGAL